MSSAIPGVAITARGLGAGGPDGVVFQDVDCTATPGSLTVVTGPAGSGRTSLLLALGGRFRTNAGTLTVDDGRSPADLRSFTAIARARPAIDLEPRLLVRETVAERKAIVGSAFTEAGLRHAYDLMRVDPPPAARVDALPVVVQLLFGVALAAAPRPRAVLVDDVDAGLAGADLTRAWQALLDLADTGTTVIATALAPPWDGADEVVRLPGHEHHARISTGGRG